MSNRAASGQVDSNAETADARVRQTHHAHVQHALRPFSRDAQLSDLRRTLQVTGQLGKGVYGIVYSARLTNDGGSSNSSCNGLSAVSRRHLALKSITTTDRPSDREVVLEKLMREEIAGAYLNALVFLDVCPNFAVVHKAFLNRHPQDYNTFYYLLCMERADGDFKKWLSITATDSSYKHASMTVPFMSAVLQVFMGLAAGGIHLNIVHNDLYLKNILFNRIRPTTLIYQLRKRTYVITAAKYLFKLSDFGICSSPTHLKNSHMSMTKMTRHRRQVGSLINFDFANHILEYQDVPPFARDAVVFLRSLLYFPDVQPVCRAWLQNALMHLEHLRRNKPQTLQGAEGLLDFISDIFSDRFLRRAGLPTSLFDPVVSQSSHTVAPDEPHISSFLDGNENTRRDVLIMARDYGDITTCNAYNGAPTPPPTLSTPPTFY